MCGRHRVFKILDTRGVGVFYNSPWVPVTSDLSIHNLTLSVHVYLLRGVYSDTTQLNWTQLDVELSTRSQREQLSPINERSDPVDSVRRLWRHKQKHDWLGCTLFNWVSWVQLSCVAINGPLVTRMANTHTRHSQTETTGTSLVKERYCRNAFDESRHLQERSRSFSNSFDPRALS